MVYNSKNSFTNYNRNISSINCISEESSPANQHLDPIPVPSNFSTLHNSRKFISKTKAKPFRKTRFKEVVCSHARKSNNGRLESVLRGLSCLSNCSESKSTLCSDSTHVLCHSTKDLQAKIQNHLKECDRETCKACTFAECVLERHSLECKVKYCKVLNCYKYQLRRTADIRIESENL